MNEYVLRSGQEGAERLRLLGRVVAPTTEALLSRVGVLEGGHCLDVGCGLGVVTLELARRVGPAGQVVGMDLDDQVVQLARQTAARQMLPVVFRTGSVMDLATESVYDLVYVRFLLSHLARPEEALHRLIGATRPGGVVVVEDTDFAGHFCYPSCPAFDRYVALYRAAVDGHGGDACLGPRIPQLMEEAGLEQVELQVAMPVFREGEGKRLAAVTLEHIRESVVSSGLLSATELDGIVAGLEAFTANPRTLISLPRIFQVWGRRPDSNPG
jgi:ubiquinone/menaquinone biosynthesis C-methylase UbiE